MSRWNEWVLLVCDMEKYKRPALQQEPIVYLGPKWLRCLQCCSGLQLIGPAHEDLRQCLGQALRLEVILLSKEKVAAPDPSPEAGRGRPRGRPRGRSCGRPRGRCRGKPRGRPRASRPASRRASRHREANPPNPQPPSKPSKPSKTLQTLQTPSPTGTPGPRPLLNQAPQGQGPPGPRPQQWLSIGFQSCRLPARKHSKRSKTLQTLQNLQTLQTPSQTLQTSRPGGML